MAALELSKYREVEYGAAFALALSGDFARSQTLANDLARKALPGGYISPIQLPASASGPSRLNHPETASRGGEAAMAIELLQISVP